MDLNSDMLSLCRRLRGEHLLVTTEVDSLTKLNSQLSDELKRLYESVWISCAQQVNLFKLIHAHEDATQDNSCSLVNELAHSQFIESYHKLQQHDAVVAGIFKLLMRNPAVVATVLDQVDILHAAGDKKIASDKNLTFNLCFIMYSSLYGCCLLPVDERQALEALNNLMRRQIVASSNPRQKLRREKCAFSRLYKLFADGLFSAKVFLTAALHEPIMDLLSQDELFLDIDPSKHLIRFPPEQRLRKFGPEGTKEHKEAMAAYRTVIVSKLVAIAAKFVEGISKSMVYFPTPLAWLVRTLHQQLASAGQVSEREIRLLCTDLIFTCFICPAVTNPEPLGIISDTPITNIARFNLMQVGQILQTLAVLPWEQVDEKCMDLYSLFEQDCVSSIITCLLESTEIEGLASLYPTNEDDSTRNLNRPISLITEDQLKLLLRFLCDSMIPVLEAQPNDAVHTELAALLHRVPSHLRTASIEQTHQQLDKPPKPGSRSSSPNPTPQQTPGSSSKKTVGSLMNKVRSGSYNRLSTLAASGDQSEGNSPNKSGLNTSMRSVSPQTLPDQQNANVVLMLSVDDDRPTVGLVSEDSYMSRIRARHPSADKPTEKRTRFLETESVGTSEMDTEACSDRASLSSSLDGLTNPEDVVSTVPDNLSDVGPISANVSGRGSPSISGRETPSSIQRGNETVGGTAAETVADDAEDATSSRQGIPIADRNLPHLPVTVQKPRENREDIEDKFGKFGLGQPAGHERQFRDDTHSLVSDSWSTDVVASDNEGGGQEGAHAMQAPGGIVPAGGLPDVIPGQQPDPMHRLDLIREEQVAPVAAVGPEDPNVAVLMQFGFDHALCVRALRKHKGVMDRAADWLFTCAHDARQRKGSGSNLTAGLGVDDRSDTWSVDAIASDSEADTNAPSRQDDELIEQMIDVDNELIAGAVAAAAAAAANNNDDEDVVAVGGAAVDLELGGGLEPEPDVEECDDAISTAATAGSECSRLTSVARSLPASGSVASSYVTPTTNDTPRVPDNVTNNAVVEAEPATVTAPVSIMTTSAAGAPLTKENLRRQSSGSSFYSKSDVESEFSRDYPDETGSTYTSEFPAPPSSRGSFGDASTVSAPPHASLLAKAQQANNDAQQGVRKLSINDVVQDGEDTPVQATASTDAVIVVNTATGDHPIVESQATPTGDTKPQQQQQPQQTRPKLRSSGATPKPTAAGGHHSILRQSPPTTAGILSTASDHKRNVSNRVPGATGRIGSTGGGPTSTTKIGSGSGRSGKQQIGGKASASQKSLQKHNSTPVNGEKTQPTQKEQVNVNQLFNSSMAGGKVVVNNSNNSSAASLKSNQSTPKTSISNQPRSQQHSKEPIGQKKSGFFHDLQQKVGDSFRTHTGKNLSPFRGSRGGSRGHAVSVSRTLDDMAGTGKPPNTGTSVPTTGLVQGTRNAQQTVMQTDKSGSTGNLSNGMTADEILNKYSATPQPTAAAPTSTRITVNGDEQSIRSTNAGTAVRPYFDPENVTRCQAFLDTKRKLRLVLSSIDVECLPCNSTSASSTTTSTAGLLNTNTTPPATQQQRPSNAPTNANEAWIMAGAADPQAAVAALRQQQALNQPTPASATTVTQQSKTKLTDELMRLLRLLLAEATNTQQTALCAQLHEVLRCLAMFDNSAVRKLIRSIKEEHRLRSSYVNYLQQSRVTLLHMRAFTDRLLVRVQREQTLRVECMIEVLVRFFLNRHEGTLRQFMGEFQQLVMTDEKTDLVEQILSQLYALMRVERQWSGADETQISRAHTALERMLFAQIYTAALYPNGDADVHRDQMLHEHMKKLAKRMTPTHPSLAIPTMLLAECPWPSAQSAIALINVYKSPRDKLACIVRCCTTIEQLCLLALQGQAPAADHITPILVFVLIQANPSALLSNIEYVRSFYERHMSGVDAYWWTQFTSAVEYIKSLFNKDIST